MEKLLVMNAAAQLASAAAASFPNTVTVDPEIKDPNLRALNLTVWELFRIFYRAIVQALADETSWPSPTIQAGKLLPNLLQSVVPVLGPLASSLISDPKVKSIVDGLLAAIPKPSPTPTSPIPDPGAPAK